MEIELLENEIWKEIPQVSGRYLISNYARLYSKKHKKILKTGRDTARMYTANGDEKIDIPLLTLMRQLFNENEDISKFAKVKSLEGEIWIPVKGYEDIYHISNYGRLKVLDRVCWKSIKNKTSTKFKKEHLSAARHGKEGYPTHILVKDNINKTRTIHRLLALHFIPNPENKAYVNHIDGDKTNNHISNLEWTTPSENMEHASRTGLLKPKSIINKKIAKEIKELIMNKEENGLLLRDIANMYGITRHIVKDISRNKTWRHVNI